MPNIYDVTGTITEIQRFSVHDGPGIRSLVFLKGCPLRCKWCCNPENLRIEPQTMRVGETVKNIGRTVTVDEVLTEIRKDRAYYRRSGGGLTISGGEVLFQPTFARALLEAAKREGFNTAMESSAFADYAVIESFLPWLDLAMCDLKHVDTEKHRQFTGRSNEMILENLRRLGESGQALTIRMPVVPTFNDTDSEIAAIAAYAASIPGVKQLHLLPYHRLAEGKYEGLAESYHFAGIEPPSSEKMAGLLAVAKRSGLNCQIGG